MSKLIIDTQTGTILNIEHCYVIDANDLSEDDFTCAELQAVADRSGNSISELMRLSLTKQQDLDATASK
jgi:hypothetical protein